MKSALIRFTAVLVLCLVTFWPTYGLLFWAWEYKEEYPLVVIILASTWAILFGLSLPLSMNKFQMVSSVAIVIAQGYVVIDLHQIGTINALDAKFLLTGGVGCIAVILGWLTVSAVIWRWARGIVVVQDSQPDVHH